MNGLKNMKIKRICKICKRKFKIFLSRIKYGRGITCSKKCQNVWVSFKNNKQIKLICKYCGKKFFRSKSQIDNKNGKGQYCSIKCAYSNKKRGELSSNWKGGRLNENEKIRKSPEYKIWIKKILKRDNFVCQICNVKNVPFHIHHIKEFSKFPDLRLSEDNGIVLCIPCHSSIHNKTFKRIRND